MKNKRKYWFLTGLLVYVCSVIMACSAPSGDVDDVYQEQAGVGGDYSIQANHLQSSMTMYHFLQKVI